MVSCITKVIYKKRVDIIIITNVRCADRINLIQGNNVKHGLTMLSASMIMRMLKDIQKIEIAATSARDEASV